MFIPRFIDFRVQVAAYAQSVGSNLGVCVGNIPALAGLVNIATQKWLYDPLQPEEGWWFTWRKVVFNVSQSNPYIVTPFRFARVIVLDVNTCPVKLQNGFYEFLDYGVGLQPKPCKQNVCNGFTQAYDRDTVATLGTLNSSPQTLRFFPTDPRDSGKTVIVSGTDQNGNVITSTDPVTNQTILGEIVKLALPFVDTVNQFSGGVISGIQKDNTFGPVTIYQVDPISGTTTQLSSMEGVETNAVYRRYLINNLPCNCPASPTGTVQVTAMCKLDYVPVASDPDPLIVPNIVALMAECEAIRYGNMDNPNALSMAKSKHADAVGLLLGQLDHFMGKERPAISVPLFGPERHLRHQPI